MGRTLRCPIKSTKEPFLGISCSGYPKMPEPAERSMQKAKSQKQDVTTNSQHCALKAHQYPPSILRTRLSHFRSPRKWDVNHSPGTEISTSGSSLGYAMQQNRNGTPTPPSSMVLDRFLRCLQVRIVYSDSLRSSQAQARIVCSSISEHRISLRPQYRRKS